MLSVTGGGCPLPLSSTCGDTSRLVAATENAGFGWFRIHYDETVSLKNEQNGQTADIWRFGAYEVRGKAGLLFHKGRRVRIQDLPLRMLVILIAHSGEVVSREQLRNLLWGEKTFVEFNTNLRVAAAKLREALGDDAASPQFVETVARRGYRFIGEAEPVVESPAVAPDAALVSSPARVSNLAPPDAALTSGLPEISSDPQSQSVQSQSAHDIPGNATAEFPSHPTTALLPLPAIASRLRRRPRALLGWGTAAVILLPCLGYALFRLANRPLLHDQDTVVLGEFSNNTRNRAIDETLSLPFHVKMGESPYLKLASGEQFEHALKSRPNPPGGPPSLNDQLAACRQLHGRVLLNGEATQSGSGFVLHVNAYSCDQSNRIATVSEKAGSQGELLMALNEACNTMRLRLGESRETLNRFNVPLIQATTSSLAALRAYRMGEQRHIDGSDVDAQTYYKLAIDLDPQFALAYLQLGLTYTNVAESAQGYGYYRRAFDLRERTTDRERLYITTSYYDYATGERDRAIKAYQLWSALYPNDVIPANNLAVDYLMIGQPREAVQNARRATELNPSLSVPFAVLAQSLLKSGDYPALKSLCDDPAHRNMVSIGYHLSCYEGAFLQGDTAAMQREMTWSRGKSQEGVLINATAETALYQGRLNEARRLFAAALQSALANNLRGYATQLELNEAAMESDLGLTELARKNMQQAYTLGQHGPEEEISMALDLALLGEFDRASEEARKAQSLAPVDTLLNDAEIPEVRAVMALRHNKPQDALRELDRMRPYDLYGVMDLAPMYYRGMAYQKLGQMKSAEEEFQTLLNHRAIAPHSLYSLLAELQLGKLLLEAGNRDAAAPLLRNLEQSWQRADSDFPPLHDLRQLTTNVHP